MGFTLHRLFVLSGLWSAFKIIFHQSLSRLSIFFCSFWFFFLSGLFYINIVGVLLEIWSTFILPSSFITRVLIGRRRGVVWRLEVF